MNTQTLVLDLSKRGSGGQCVTIGQGDVGGTTIEAEVYDSGAALDLSGFAAEFVARLPDRSHYVRQAAGTSGGKVSYVVDEAHVAAIDGYTDEAYFTLTKDGKTYSTERFALDIKRSALDGTPAQSWDSVVDKLEEEAERIIEASQIASATVTMLPRGSDPTASVTQGEAGRELALGIPKADVDFATFDVDPLTGSLWVTYSEGSNVAFALENDCLEVEVIA